LKRSEKYGIIKGFAHFGVLFQAFQAARNHLPKQAQPGVPVATDGPKTVRSCAAAVVVNGRFKLGNRK